MFAESLQAKVDKFEKKERSRRVEQTRQSKQQRDRSLDLEQKVSRLSEKLELTEREKDEAMKRIHSL